jgi:hypothetical protein
MAESGGQSPKGAFRTIVYTLVLILAVLYAGKVYIREPEYRHIEACYLPFKVGHLFWVDAWGAVVTNDTGTHLKHSRDMKSFFASCTSFMGKQSWLLGSNGNTQITPTKGNDNG